VRGGLPNNWGAAYKTMFLMHCVRRKETKGGGGGIQPRKRAVFNGTTADFREDIKNAERRFERAGNMAVLRLPERANAGGDQGRGDRKWDP